ncbi:PorV/PorQ family protein [bacterium]|nr:PorV/PorQ family protein [bacterium]MBU1072366.1 PorV/PorQ family protein [bacterium]MBU1675514.1 PorV/PorQ family protein [bacterium]
MKRIALLVIVALALPQAANAQLFAKVGTFGAQFLQIGTSARATGMGSAFTAIADDASSVFWNPAGLVEVRGNEFHASQVEWPADINLSSAVLAFNPRILPGTFALSVRSLWLDPMLVRTAYLPEGNGQTFDAGMVGFGFSYSRFWTDKFSAGFTLNYLHMGLAEEAVNTASFDFGIIYRIGVRGLRLGMVIQNLGGKITYDELPAKMPTIFKVGASFNITQTSNHSLLASGEFQHPSDNTERANLGLEYKLKELLYLRGGYYISYDTEEYSGGFGVIVNTGKDSRAIVDYSMVSMTALDLVHRLSLTVTY